MPHLIRDVAGEVLKDFLFLKVVRHEREECRKLSDLRQEKDAVLLQNASVFFDIPAALRVLFQVQVFLPVIQEIAVDPVIIGILV